jgi:hypothetical protein
MAQVNATSARMRAALAAVAPTVLLAGFFYHPYLSVPTDPAVIAAAVGSNPTRWALAHLAVGVGYGLFAVAFLGLRSYLREAGEERWSVIAVPFIVMGSTLFAILTGMEFGPLAAAAAGADATASQAALFPWFVPVLFTGAVAFAVGALCFAMAILRSHVLGPSPSRLVVGALILMVVARFAPIGIAQYVIAVAGVAALWPVAFAMWRRPGARPGGTVATAPAT